MKRGILQVLIGASLCAALVGGGTAHAQGGVVSTARDQFVPGVGTARHQDLLRVVENGMSDEIEPFASFLNTFVGLDAVDVQPGGAIWFSVGRDGLIDGTRLRPQNVYSYDGLSITEQEAWSGWPRPPRSVDALDRLNSGAIAFSTSSTQLAQSPENSMVLRHENVYSYLPGRGIVMAFDGRLRGLRDLDGIDLSQLELGNPVVVFSTSTDVFASGTYVRQQNVYEARTDGIFEVFDGRASRLQTIDALAALGPDNTLELVSISNPPVTAQLDPFGACMTTVSDWSAILQNASTGNSPFDGLRLQAVTIDYEWSDGVSTTPTRVVGLGGVTIPAGATGTVVFRPIAFEDLSPALLGQTANVTLVFDGVTETGAPVQATATRQLLVESCGQSPIVAGFVASGTAASPNSVRLLGQATNDRVQVDIVIAGPTTSADLYGFAITLLLGDPALVELVAGSASVGDALAFDSGQQTAVLASQSGDRITIGVTKLGGGPGNGVPPGERVIVSFELRVLQVGETTLALSGPAASAAIDSTGSTIEAVTFDAGSAMISGI